MPHYPELLENVPEGIEPSVGNCGDQEEHGFYLKSWIKKKEVDSGGWKLWFDIRCIYI